jgi:hypothetical protein
MFEIISGEQYHTTFEPDDIRTRMDDIDLQFFFGDWTGALITQKHIIIVMVFSKAVKTVAARVIRAASVDPDARI